MGIKKGLETFNYFIEVDLNDCYQQPTVDRDEEERLVKVRAHIRRWLKEILADPKHPYNKSIRITTTDNRKSEDGIVAVELGEYRVDRAPVIDVWTLYELREAIGQRFDAVESELFQLRGGDTLL